MTAESLKPTSQAELSEQFSDGLISTPDPEIIPAKFEKKRLLSYESNEQESYLITFDIPVPSANRKDFFNPDLEQVLANITYPTPNINDERDQDEVQIYQFLGDITLPRSFIPAIDVLANQQLEAQIKARDLYFQQRPHKKQLFEEAEEVDWIGKSKRVNERFLKAQRKKYLNLLTGTREMTELRTKAWELFSKYTKSKVAQSGLSESYFTKKSIELWEKMSTYAKDYLRYGTERNVRVNLDEGTLDEVMSTILDLTNVFSSTGNKGTIFIDDNKPDDFYSWNSIDFQFDGDKITRLRLDEGTIYKQHSPLLSFIEANRNANDIKNNISECEHIGAFNLQVVFHAFSFGEHKITIDIDIGNWSSQRIYEFIASYLKIIKTEPKSEGISASFQLRDSGVLKFPL